MPRGLSTIAPAIHAFRGAKVKARVLWASAVVLVAAASAAIGGAGGAPAANAPDLKAARPAGAERATVTLSITRLGNGTITSTPAGILCGPGPTETSCSADFAAGTQLTLRAQPILGWAWNYWDGACVGRTTPTCGFRITEAASVLVIFVGVDGFTASFKPTWDHSLLSGTLDVAGIASHDANLTVTLLTRSAKILASGQVAVPSPGGNFSASIPLRRLKVLPGRYIAQLRGAVSNRQIPGRDIGVVLRPPREGVVGRTFVTPLGSSKAVTTLPRGAIGAEAHFVFANRPASGSRIVATWFQGRIKLGSASKPRARIVRSKVARRGGLPRGFFYRCVLTVNGVVVKEAGVKTGR
jgi:hypothetical protein